MQFKLPLPDGADESINLKRVLYLRDPLSFEIDEEPDVRAIVMLPGIKLYSVVELEDLVAQMAAKIRLGALTAPNGAVLKVHVDAVKDVDDPVSTNPPKTRSWLVFGTGPKARRLSVKEDRDALRTIWMQLGADPSASNL
ncbi:MAG: hypothetical protein AAGF10_04380 [Verrucomicrobiota bacterium]